MSADNPLLPSDSSRSRTKLTGIEKVPDGKADALAVFVHDVDPLLAINEALGQGRITVHAGRVRRAVSHLPQLVCGC